MGKNGDKKLAYDEFVIRSIKALRQEGRLGIHTVYSGFNNALKAYYGAGTDPVTVTKGVEEKGYIDIRPAKGGAMLYMKGEGPKDKTADVLAAILAD